MVDKRDVDDVVGGEFLSPGNERIEHTQLLELWEYRMPFGKYKGLRLVNLPEPYVVWFAQKGFPESKLGNLLQIVYEIKVNGLEYLFDPIRRLN